LVLSEEVLQKQTEELEVGGQKEKSGVMSLGWGREWSVVNVEKKKKPWEAWDNICGK